MTDDYETQISELTDAQLQKGFDVAKFDLELAAQNERNSEWHDACFAAVLIYARHLMMRGIDQRALH